MKKPRKRLGGLTAPELVALRSHRLEANLTYRALAAEIGIATSKLYELLHDANVVPNERTSYKVRAYQRTLRKRSA